MSQCFSTSVCSKISTGKYRKQEGERERESERERERSRGGKETKAEQTGKREEKLPRNFC